MRGLYSLEMKDSDRTSDVFEIEYDTMSVGKLESKPRKCHIFEVSICMTVGKRVPMGEHVYRGTPGLRTAVTFEKLRAHAPQTLKLSDNSKIAFSRSYCTTRQVSSANPHEN